MNFVDPSGHDAIYLNSSKGAAGLGHAAILLRSSGKWRYYSWESKGYKSGHAQLKVVKKGIKGKTVTKSINNAKNVKRPKEKPYDKYIYLAGNYAGSYIYANEQKAGKHYKKYHVATTNCAWIAIQLLRQGAIGKGRKSALRALQYKKKINSQGEEVEYKATIIPNTVLSKVGSVLGHSVKKLSDIKNTVYL